jgi:hypothetical protein
MNRAAAGGCGMTLPVSFIWTGPETGARRGIDQWEKAWSQLNAARHLKSERIQAHARR